MMNMSVASSNPSGSVGVVGGSPGLRRVSAMGVNDKVDDGDSPGTGSSSWGGSNRRRLSSSTAANSGEIPATWCSPCSGEGCGMFLRERGTNWCEEIERGRPLFIVARGDRRARAGLVVVDGIGNYQRGQR